MKDEVDELRLIGSNIRRLRKSRGWSLQHLATLIGEDFSALARYERGENQPGVFTAKKIASALGSSLDAITEEMKVLEDVA